MGSNAVVEFAFCVPTGSAAGGTQDLSIGLADGTHATDADSIAKDIVPAFKKYGFVPAGQYGMM